MLAPLGSFLLPALLASTSCLVGVHAHGGHGGSYDEHGAEDDTLGYAERHMRSEHHIDAFDAESFFHLHDLDHDGILNVEEIEAIYGLHHDSSKAASSSGDTHTAKAKIVVEKVLALLDKDKDGVVTLSEFIEAGAEGLPDFKGFEELGHHYDEESEYFLHHEERFHSTPETQTDEAYNHPEDIAHFQHHEDIEKVEDDRAKVFLEGETPTHADMPHEAPPKDLTHERKVPSVSERLSKDRIAAQNEDGKYGEGEKGFKRPRTARDKMRRGTPYKYKFRRSPKEF